MTNSLVVNTHWGIKKEVMLTRHPIIEKLYFKYFNTIKFRKKFAQFRINIQNSSFFRDYEAFYNNNTEYQPFNLDNYDGDILYQILDDIADDKESFFLKHVEIHKRYYSNPENLKYHLGVYYIIIFDDYMYSFIKQSKYWTKEYIKETGIYFKQKHIYSAQDSILFFWIDYIFSETEENKKAKVKELDNLYNNVCIPMFKHQKRIFK